MSRFVPGCTAFDYHDQEQVAQALRMARRLHESGVVSPWSFDFYDESLKIEGLLREVLAHGGYRVGLIAASPAEGLIKYHYGK